MSANCYEGWVWVDNEDNLPVGGAYFKPQPTMGPQHDGRYVQATLVVRFGEAAPEKVECGLPLVRPTTRMWLGHCTEPSGHDGAHYRSVPGARFVGEAATREESLHFGRITPSAPAETNAGLPKCPECGEALLFSVRQGIRKHECRFWMSFSERAFLRALAESYSTPSLTTVQGVKVAARRVVEER